MVLSFLSLSTMTGVRSIDTVCLCSCRHHQASLTQTPGASAVGVTTLYVRYSCVRVVWFTKG